MADKITKTVAYLASSLHSLPDLESSCNRDEAVLGKVINIELAAMDKQDGAKAVAITYEKVPLSTTVNIGHLTLMDFNNEVDANVKTTNLKGAGATPVLPGDNPSDNKSRAKVFIGNDTVQILVFRKKKAV